MWFTCFKHFQTASQVVLVSKCLFSASTNGQTSSTSKVRTHNLWKFINLIDNISDLFNNNMEGKISILGCYFFGSQNPFFISSSANFIKQKLLLLGALIY